MAEVFATEHCLNDRSRERSTDRLPEHHHMSKVSAATPVGTLALGPLKPLLWLSRIRVPTLR